MKKNGDQVAPEGQARAVCLGREQRRDHPSMGAAVESIVPICCTPQTLHEWVKRDQVDHGDELARLAAEWPPIFRAEYEGADVPPSPYFPPPE
ncbi:hypothetical protein KTE13_02820 [Burkholderia multivorans]|uniref:hypothetical protein n=1 Tax=Burkholderia multivorans TaxID=87883 RepID=UPI000A4434A9|nr:hypothetical protein [Burkholderia multivorans]MBU9589630.1 hypothetical protein [Burkholderia multivorans]